jgi:N-acetylmuramoyl-L-alanine amidase CwlA
MYKNIILHWTAGGYMPNSVDKEYYHYMVDDKGNVYNGKFTPEDNLNCNDGKYAQHCGGGNTGRIGLAICCRKDITTQPTRVQVEAMCNLAAQLCKKYGLKPYQCITHAEFGKDNPKTSSAGKIDINYLPYIGLKGVKEVGDYLRNKIKWYFEKLA